MAWQREFKAAVRRLADLRGDAPTQDRPHAAVVLHNLADTFAEETSGLIKPITGTDESATLN